MRSNLSVTFISQNTRYILLTVKRERVTLETTETKEGYKWL